jgi:hypothetical protein
MLYQKEGGATSNGDQSKPEADLTSTKRGTHNEIRRASR